MNPKPPPLNDDVTHQIFTHLDDPADLAHAGATTRHWRSVASDPSLWSRFLPPTPHQPTCPHDLFLTSQAWSSAAALVHATPTPSRPAHMSVAHSNAPYAVAVAPAVSARPPAFGPLARATPIALYSRMQSASDSMLPVAIAHVPHHCGGIPAVLRLRHSVDSCGNHTLLAAYGYEDGRVALFSLPSERAVADGASGPVEPRCVFTSTALGGLRITAIDINEACWSVVIGTMFGGVAVFVPEREASSAPGSVKVARARVSGSAVLSLRASGAATAGLAGTTVGEVLAFDLERSEVNGTSPIVNSYVGPSRHPVAAVEYAAGGGMVAATYVPTNANSMLPVATAWDSTSCRRVGRFQTQRLRVRRAGARDVAVGGDDGGGFATKMGLLLGGTVLVYDIRRWECIAEVGDDTVGSLSMRGDRLAVGRSTAAFSPRAVGGVDGPSVSHSMMMLDFGIEAARSPRSVVSRFPPDRESDRPWCVSPPTAAQHQPHALARGEEEDARVVWLN